jgi:formylglycine-generating enzyme required for sulfatase activity
MIDVTGGEFTIGAATTTVFAVNGSGSVTLDDFKMSETPVTQAQFSAVMGVNPSNFACGGGGATSGGLNYRPNADLPVEWVSWYDAITYCNKLSILEGKTPVYSIEIEGIDSLNLSGVGSDGHGWRNLPYSDIPTGDDGDWNAVTQNLDANGYRLPTEAQWEYAARGGQKSITNDDSHPDHGTGKDYDYSGGNVLADVGWYSANNGIGGNTGTPFYGTKSVKSLAPNALGLYDMSGNVYEWCWNWYQSYAGDDKGTDPVGPDTGSNRLHRGGYWLISATSCRVSYRTSSTPSYRIYLIGFRVVLAP